MSWYYERIFKMREELENKTPGLSNKDDNRFDSVLLTITNMLTSEDFNIIRQEFLALDGIIEVKLYLPKKIQVLYDNRKVSLQHIALILKSTGYNYINRACKNCLPE